MLVVIISISVLAAITAAATLELVSELKMQHRLVTRVTARMRMSR